ncbi:oxidoreductase [Flavobacterium sp.]|uniref:WD40/YVTN/BNR-like repeat-containing protein n=1 Tax=Flavobacterium sp. TaxID=239 RepID=UPI0022CA7137|nr:oxidoreductase [Flavobacterium sp.]MCZ8228768.1 oxidoreductase [Flavobacterium sp.]
MVNKITIILFFSVLCGYLGNAQKSAKIDSFFQKIEIDTLFEDKISIRSLTIDKDKIWFAADQNRYGFYDVKKREKVIHKLSKDSLKFECRSSAITPNHFFALTIASPALLFRVDKKNLNTELVYQNANENVFFDSLQFWNSKEGIALGDPIDNYFSIIITRDGGKTWQPLANSVFYKNIEGEGAFAASNTNIVIQGNHTWVVSGGKSARIFHSADKGKSWTVAETPIIQGQQMTGIFSAAFYDQSIGCIAGGNYELPNQNFGNKAITKDGGKTWQLIAENSGPGYISCVQFVPNSKGNGLVTVGATGIHYSSDGGASWKLISSDASLYTLRFIDDATAIAAGKNKMIRLSLKK